MPEEQWLNDSVFVVENLITIDECERLIRISEDAGYEDATVSTPQGTAFRTDVRNNQRAMLNDHELANQLWKAAEPFIPAEINERTPVGANELLRFYRYDPGQQFNWHQDFPYERDNGESSLLTFMIYLSEDCDGGETSFEDSYSDESFDEFSVSPKAGMGLFFLHEVHHKGEPVHEGRKYVLRTDIMFSPDEDEIGRTEYH